MRPLAGDYAFLLFALGCSMLRCLRHRFLPLSTSYTVCEGLGFESGVDKRFKEAPTFYWLYTLLIVGGSATVLVLPDAQLINFAILSQVLNGVLLPVVIILMLMLINRTGPDGQTQEFARVERGGVEHEYHRDRDDGSDAVGNVAGALRRLIAARSWLAISPRG